MEESGTYPLDIQISFHKIIEKYREKLKTETSSLTKVYVESLLTYVSAYPELSLGIKSAEELSRYEDSVKLILKDLFPDILSHSEIKAVSVPFRSFIFNPTEKFKKILDNAGEDYELEMTNSDPDMEYISACVRILNSYYGYELEFNRALYYDIPDSNGMLRHYRINVDWEFMDIIPTSSHIDLTEEEIDLLVQDIEDIELWKKMLPLQNWQFKGFTILTLTDVTVDEAISNLKTRLLKRRTSPMEELRELEGIFRTIFKIPDLRIGYTIYNEQDSTYGNLSGESLSHSLFAVENEEQAKLVAGELAYTTLIKEQQNLIISNVKAFSKAHSETVLSKKLLEEEAKSAILAPITKNQKLFGVLEVIAFKKNQLNTVNAKNLDGILPYLATAVERNITEYENRVKAVIQSECTSIHPSVLWIFEKEAQEYIKGMEEDGLASFRDITLEDVHPLYGQIDIVASSEARNNAIQKDLLFQLELLVDIITRAYEIQPLPYYEDVKFRIDEFKEEVQANLNASSEHKFFQLLKKELNPLLQHLKKQTPEMKGKVAEYQAKVDSRTGLIYNHRRNYDEAVQQINRTLSRYIDNKQLEAQKAFPHYFERYKTDGVDHNIYIGASLINQKQHSFDKVFLYNLRIWQLATMCEMENKFYQVQENLPVTLEAASLILVYNSTISIRYRMDEKRFDVDGAYNARYEIIKKRIDKACIKGTDERVTQCGKLAIVYSQNSDEKEYLRYIKYLQRKNYLGTKVELLELEDVQGVVGLKAIRVDVLYHSDSQSKNNELVTYDDLLNELR